MCSARCVFVRTLQVAVLPLIAAEVRSLLRENATATARGAAIQFSVAALGTSSNRVVLVADSDGAGLSNLKAGDGVLRLIPLSTVQGRNVANTGNVIEWGANTLGFFNAAPTAKLTVTGSRGGNAALASLLTQLASYGLITDGSSA